MAACILRPRPQTAVASTVHAHYFLSFEFYIPPLMLALCLGTLMSRQEVGGLLICSACLDWVLVCFCFFCVRSLSVSVSKEIKCADASEPFTTLEIQFRSLPRGNLYPPYHCSSLHW